ncbi:ABC transporter permease [Neomegalonema sp.]|uniref:ABC transporter permease n=1 Tax=Neomegalonema sp. TaxID=2039713 RepID=UPI0026246CC4|nr:ABC transporter permease [Neomegalonema sp.]MDD2869729.1 ABC transporter permease [Neomegalonema sp.]
MPKLKNSQIAALTLLALPVLVYLALYLAPLASIGRLSVDNGALSQRFPALSARFGETEAPDDAAAAALLTDLKAMARTERAEAGRLFNQELGGMRSLIIDTGGAATQIEPTLSALTAFDPRWGEPAIWEVVRRNVEPITWRHFQRATGLKPSAEGGFEMSPGDDVYLRILLRTFVIGLQVTALTLLIGYPLAYAAATGSRRVQAVVLMAVLLSFWTSLLVRTTAWVVLLQTNGLLNGLLMWLNLIPEPLQLIFNRFGAVVAMTHVLLPFAILPMINVMRTIPAAQTQASRSLGAGPVESFLRVYFPQSLRGVAVGGGTVFILALGFYVTPALTGGPGDQMLSYYIADFVRRGLNWGMAAVLSIFLLVCVVALLVSGALLRRAFGWSRSSAASGGTG